MDKAIPVFIANEARQGRIPGINGKFLNTFQGMPLFQIAAFAAGVSLAKERVCCDSLHFGF
jgi:hypothetical protein